MKIKSLIVSAVLCAFFFGHSALGQTTFTKHSIASPAGPIDVYACDINGDELNDILTITYPAGEVSWWENNGGAGFAKHIIKNGLTGGRSVRGGDIDGDGDTDVIAAGITANRIEWYENTGSGTFSTHVLTSDFRGAHTVELTDLDLDGHMDILCSGWDNSDSKSELAWWKNNGSQVFTKYVVSNTLDQSPFAAAADFDSDGDIDLVALDEAPGEIYWYKNNGQMNFEEITISSSFGSAHTLTTGDLDRDGDHDILVNSYLGPQAWYENDGLGSFEKHSLQSLSGAMFIDMGDFDLDGDEDIIAVGTGATKISLYSNDGTQRFIKSSFSSTLSLGFGLNAADLDNDGDLDVVAVGFQSNTLAWWENDLDRTSLLDNPAWIIPGIVKGEFLVSNPDRGNIIKCNDVDPYEGIASGVYREGMLLADNVLWVTEGPILKAFDFESGILLKQIRTETQLLSVVTMTPSGIAYVSAPLDGKVFSFDPETENVALVSDQFQYPGALKYDQILDKIVVLDGEQTVNIKTLDVHSGGIEEMNHTSIEAGGDIVSDGLGNYYLSSPIENKIYSLISDLSSEPVQYTDELQGPMGMWYDDDNSELVVVMNTGDALQRIPATATGINSLRLNSAADIKVNMIPNTPILNITINNLAFDEGRLLVVAVSGQEVVLNKDMMNKPGEDAENLFRCQVNLGRHLSPGVYVVGFQSGTTSVFTKFIIPE